MANSQNPIELDIISPFIINLITDI